MKKEDLIALGVTEDLAKQIMALHGADMTKAKAEDATNQETINELKQQLSERDKDLKNLEKNVTNVEELKQQLETMKDDYKKQAQDYEERITSTQKNALLTSILSESKAKNPKIIESYLQKDQIKLEDGQLVGAQEQIEALQKSDPYLFDMGTSQGGYNPPKGSATVNYASFEEAMEKGGVEEFLRIQAENESEEN